MCSFLFWDQKYIQSVILRSVAFQCNQRIWRERFGQSGKPAKERGDKNVFHFFGERNSYKSVVKRDFQKQTTLEKGAVGEGEGMKEVVR